jgi:GNAT superfamily N-acetyltransferase
LDPTIGGDGVLVRTAGEDDLDGLTRLLSEAFQGDPLWRWAFPDGKGLERWWRFYIASALRYPLIWIAGDFDAASVWIPPGGEELTAEEERRVEPLLRDLVGDRTPDVLALLERFERSHPHAEEHYYLSLLGTAPRCRGRGIGMALLAENLRSVDEAGAPAYLESSNPANDRRYERAGFRRVGAFTTPDGERTVATMWRDPSPRDTARSPRRVEAGASPAQSASE